MSATTTPRTDEEYERLAFGQEAEPGDDIGIRDSVFFGMRDFARQLERELTAKTAELEEFKKAEKQASDQSLLAAIDGNLEGMTHADLVLTCKMLTNGRAAWRKEAETAQATVKAIDDLAHELTGDEGEDDSITVLRAYVKKLKAEVRSTRAAALEEAAGTVLNAMMGAKHTTGQIIDNYLASIAKQIRAKAASVRKGEV